MNGQYFTSSSLSKPCKEDSITMRQSKPSPPLAFSRCHRLTSFIQPAVIRKSLIHLQAVKMKCATSPWYSFKVPAVCMCTGQDSGDREIVLTVVAVQQGNTQQALLILTYYTAMHEKARQGDPQTPRPSRYRRTLTCAKAAHSPPRRSR